MILWLGLSLVLVVGAVVFAYRQDSPMARIGLYCVAAAAGLWFLAVLFG
jgi:hypothetical protein